MCTQLKSLAATVLPENGNGFFQTIIKKNPRPKKYYLAIQQ
jgi:hypothetical protein